MTIDHNQTGVPNGRRFSAPQLTAASTQPAFKRQRVQMTKPVQMNNAGLSRPVTHGSQPQPFNPVQPAQPAVNRPQMPQLSSLPRQADAALGQYGLGNIDLNNPSAFVRGPNGGIGTAVMNDNNRQVLLPNMARDASGNPTPLTNQQIAQNYRDTGENFGTFDTTRDALRYADVLNQGMDFRYDRPEGEHTHASGQYPSAALEAARQAISGMTSAEVYSLLQAMSDGSLTWKR